MRVRSPISDEAFILGLYGGDNPVDEDRAMHPLDHVSGHDANAAIVQGGKILAACEQERLDRIKHSNKAPMLAARACLQKCGLSIADVAVVVIPVLEAE